MFDFPAINQHWDTVASLLCIVNTMAAEDFATQTNSHYSSFSTSLHTFSTSDGLTEVIECTDLHEWNRKELDYINVPTGLIMNHGHHPWMWL